MARNGHNIQAINERPELFPDLKPYWDAFQVLNGSRDVGFTVNPIRLTEIKAYLEMYEIDRSEWIEFVQWIKYLDGIYLTLVNSQEGKRNAGD